MSDPERLTEAITQMEVRGASVASQAAAAGIGTDLVLVLAAARAYRDLLANGRVVDNTVIAWPGVEGLGAGKYLVVELDPTTEEER